MRISNTTERLKEIMAERHLRQVDVLNLAKPFCEKYGVKLTKPDISQYLSHQVEPGREKLFILALALEVDDAWLMGYDVAKERTATHIYNHSQIGNENFHAIQTLLNNAGYNFKFFCKKYQIETPTGLIATLTPDDLTKLERSSIEHLQFIIDSIIKERFISDDIIMENNCGNRNLYHDKTYLEPVAAHERTDIEVTDEMKHHDDDLMDNDDLWK